jgi:hypothetical protein
MTDQICEVCGYRSLLGAVERHQVIPKDITERAGITNYPTMAICRNCRRELETWYPAKVAKMVYDTSLPHFRYRTPAEMFQEYESIFKSFVDYKKKQKA